MEPGFLSVMFKTFLPHVSKVLSRNRQCFVGTELILGLDFLAPCTFSQGRGLSLKFVCLVRSALLFSSKGFVMFTDVAEKITNQQDNPR